jgi:AcrR family transcriptional regulator
MERGRPPKYDVDEILDRARDLLVGGGPRAVSARGVAASLGAPSGSVYHRFASRDALLAGLWLRSVERFECGFLATLAEGEEQPLKAARAAALHLLAFCRENRSDARVLLYRLADLVDVLPDDAAARHGDQIKRIGAALERLAGDLGVSRRRVTYAVVDAPLAAVRRALLHDQPIDDELDTILLQTVDAVLSG